MLSLIIIVLSVGAFFYLRKQWYEKSPNCQEAKVGALLGVPTFYICYCLTEVVRLFGGASRVFNRTGYQHLMSGTDAEWDANVFAFAFNNMDDSTRNEWAFTSMAENLSQFIALGVLVLGVLMIYKLFNPSAMPNFRFKTLAIISAIASVAPYGLMALGMQQGIIWGIFVFVLAVFGWTYYLYIKALERYAEIPQEEAGHNTSLSTQTPLTTQNETKQCPFCGETILAIAKKCKHCGEWLPEEEVKVELVVDCPICGEEIDATLAVCTYCNEPVPEGLETRPKSDIDQ